MLVVDGEVNIVQLYGALLLEELSAVQVVRVVYSKYVAGPVKYVIVAEILIEEVCQLLHVVHISTN